MTLLRRKPCWINVNHIAAKSSAEKQQKDAQTALDKSVLTRYAQLNEADIKSLVVDDKWFAAIQHAAVEGEVQRLSLGLTGRVKQLEERYVHPLPELKQDVAGLSTRVEAHLRKLGMMWV